jgi:hypothetical protein
MLDKSTVHKLTQLDQIAHETDAILVVSNIVSVAYGNGIPMGFWKDDTEKKE